MSEYKGYTKAIGKANQKYAKANLSIISFRVKKDRAEELKQRARDKGMSISAYFQWLSDKENTLQ